MFDLTDPFIEAHYHAASNQLADQMAALSRQISMDQALNTADLSEQYPQLDRDIILGAGMLGLQSGSTEMQEIAIRSTLVDAEDEQKAWWEKVGGWFDNNLWDPTLGVIKGALRTGFTVFDAMWNEGLARPFKAVVSTLGMSDQHGLMSPINAWAEAGTSYGMKALGQLLSGDWSNINLGSGFVPRSEGAADFQALVGQGIDPRQAETQVRQNLGVGPLITEQAHAEQSQLTMQGLPITIGRTVTAPLVALDRVIPGGTLFEPGSIAYNIMSGGIDAGVMLGTMRVGRIPGGVPAVWGSRAIKPLRGKAIPFVGGKTLPFAGKKIPMPGDPAATMLKHLGVIRREARTFGMGVDDAAITAELTARGYGRMYGGLVKAVRKTVHAPTAESWLASPLGQGLCQLVDNRINDKNWAVLVDWLSVRNPHLPAQFYRELRDASTDKSTDTAFAVFSRWINAGGMGTAPTVVGTLSPLQGRLSRQAGKMLGGAGKKADPALQDVSRELGYLGGLRAGRRAGLDSFGWGRLFKDMSPRVLHVDDANQGFQDLNEWMIQAGFDVERRSTLLSDWEELVKGEHGNVGAYKVAVDAFDALAGDLLAAGVPNRLANWLTHTFRDVETGRLYFTDRAGHHAWHPADRVKLESDEIGGIITPTPQTTAEYMLREIPLPDAREMRHALSQWRRWMYFEDEGGAMFRRTGKVVSRIGKNPSRMEKVWLQTMRKGDKQVLELNDNAVQRFLDSYTQTLWKPMTLLRIAWPVRVIGEEQLRMSAAGYTSMFQHPLQALTWAITDPKANRFTKTLDWLGIRPRGNLLTDYDFGDLDPQLVQKFVTGAQHGTTADEAAAFLRHNGFPDIDPADPADILRIQDIRDHGLEAEDFLVNLAHQFQESQSRHGGYLWGHPKNPIASEVWAPVSKDSPGYYKGWVRELLQLHSDSLARRIAVEGPAAAKTWLRSGEGRTWRLELARRMQDRASAARFADDRSVDLIVDSLHARIAMKTGSNATMTIDGQEILSGQMLTADQIRILENPAEFSSRVEYHVDPDRIDPDLRTFVGTGEWAGLGNVGRTMRSGQLDTLSEELERTYRHAAPENVKGVLDGSAKKVFGDSWDKVVNFMFDRLMSKPTNLLSRSPVFKQKIWRFLSDSIPHASPTVHESILRAARNADLTPGMVRELEVRIASSQAHGAYGTMDDAVQLRTDRIVAIDHMDDATLATTVASGGVLHDLEAADPTGMLNGSDWWFSRLTKLDADDLDDSDLALYVLWSRHADEYGHVTEDAMEQLNHHVGVALGVDMTPRTQKLRRLLRAQASGTSTAELAVAEGVSNRTMQRWLKDAHDRGIVATTGDLDRRLDGLWDLFGAERGQRFMGDHFDRYTDLISGGRQARSPHSFDMVHAPDGTVLHDGWEDLTQLAKAHALEEVKGLLYDSTRRHGIMDVMRNVFPFGEAWVEVLSTWARLMGENPQLWRRGQQLIEGARGAGFLFTDPSSGEEVFNYPGAGMLFNSATKKNLGGGLGAAIGTGVGVAAAAVTGGGMGLGAMLPGLGGMIGGGLTGAMAPMGNPAAGPLGIPSEGQPGVAAAGTEVGMRAEGSLGGLNLMTGSWVPGFGPVVQVAFSHLVGDNPMFDTVRKIVTPFGDQRITEVGDLADLTLPRWATRLMGAVGVQTPDQKRVFGNTVIDVYKTLVLTQGEPADADASNRYLKQAQQIAGKLTLYRAFAYMFAPTPPEIRFEARDRDGQLWLFQTLATEYANILHEESGGDDVAAFDTFWRRFGLDPTLFATSKSIQIAPRNLTTAGDQWARSNKDLFSLAPATAYYSHPDDPTDETFDYRAYVRQLQDGAREGLTPEQWQMRRHDTLGRILYEKARREFDSANPQTSAGKTVALRMVRQWLVARYPGYKVPIPGAPQTYSADQKMREMREQWFGQSPTGFWPDGSIRWEGNGRGGDPRLRDSQAGRALWRWLQTVDAMTGMAVDSGLTAGGLWSARSAFPLREGLRRTAAKLMRDYPDFQYVYRLVLEQMFPDDDMQLSTLASASSRSA